MGQVPNKSYGELAEDREVFVAFMVLKFDEFALTFDDWSGYPPYRLMSQFAFDLAAREVECLERGTTLELADRVFAFLEAEYEKGDENIRDLIAIGFLESLRGEPGDESLAKRLPDNLSERFDGMWQIT